jgi:vacuolar-type H+-ATPase subunit H
MTASAIAGDREKCLDSGMNNYLAKPVRAQTLKALLESYLNKEGEEKEIPDLQDEAKKLVKEALSETQTVPSQMEKKPVKKPQDVLVEEESEGTKMRSRPASVKRATTQRWVGTNGKDDSAPAS